MHFEGNRSFDLGNLCLSDISTISLSDLSKTTTENIQALLGKIAKLPRKETISATLLELPEPISVLPRANPPPAQKKMTPWEKFRLKNGLGYRRKRSRMVYDQQSDDWYPRWGPYSIKKLQDKRETILEEQTEGEDPFEVRKREREVSKLTQKKQTLKNQLSGTLESKKNKKGVDLALNIAKGSTASLQDTSKIKKKPRQDKNTKEELKHNLDILKVIKKKSKA